MRPEFHISATVPAPSRALARGLRGGWIRLPVRWGLLRHPEHGPVLIDTGYTSAVTADPGRSLGLRAYQAALRARLTGTGTMTAVLARAGIAADDVRHVIVTHLHANHVAGLKALPRARFHVAIAAIAQLDRPRRTLLRHGIFPELLPEDFVARADPLESRRMVAAHEALGDGHDVFGDGAIVAVPLPGHADGHVGLLFRGATPLLYACDAQWVRDALQDGRHPGPPLSLICADRTAWRETTARLRAFAGAGGEIVLCHDPAPTRQDAGQP